MTDVHLDVQELRITLTVDDFDAAVRLYRDALGLPEVADWSSDRGRVLLLDAGRATLELFDEAQAAMVDELEVGRRVSGKVRFALQVPDADAAAAELVGAGASRVADAVDTPWGDRNARVAAPDGMQLTLFTLPGS
jgi:catechol 2,3-dioxygenase-like lactoylglutathione lyase family enzyme